MEDGRELILLQPGETEIMKISSSAFCSGLEKKFGCTAQIQNVEDHGASSFSQHKPTIVPEIKYSKQLYKGLKVSVWKDDLTTHKADAVVNAANEHLSHGAGLAQALSQAGGPMIKKWSQDIITQMGKVPTGKAVATPAGNLPCKMIIHAVGPCVSLNPTKPELIQASDLLHGTIWSILQKAVLENVQSVAIPAISSGICNFPLQKCAEIIVRTMEEFSYKRNPGARSLEVRLVNHDNASVQQMHKACCEILGQSEPIPIQNQGNAQTQSVVSRLDLGNITLYLKNGAIENETTDVIVNTIGADLDLKRGNVSAALLGKAGQMIQKEIKSHGYGSEGEVIETAGYNLHCKAVYHTVCMPKSDSQKGQTKAHKILSSVVKKCLMKATTTGFSSISFPALGTGKLGHQNDEVSEIMTKAVVDFSETYNGSKTKIFFIIFPKDTLTLKAFEKEMASTTKRQQTFQNSSSPKGKSSGIPDTRGFGTAPYIELFGPSPEALREAKRWTYGMLHLHSGTLKIYNNHIVHLSQEDHRKLMSLQVSFNVIITEFFKEGKGGIIINGEPVGISCAALEVEAMLCQAQEEFARTEEKDMQTYVGHMFGADDSGQQQIERMSNSSYQKTRIDLSTSDRAIKEKLKDFARCGLTVVKMEKIENDALKQLFKLNSQRIQDKPQSLYQCVKAQFCDLICRVGFQREYAPPKEQKYGAGIYFTSDVNKARSLWMNNEEEYIYFIDALVLTGKDKHGSPELIVPPPKGKDPLVRYDSLSNKKDIYVIFSGQQACPEFLITCSRHAA
ncbi:protein mono-ADP-ribosyltransferase PARP9-like [Neoarius graeffei]|uniref:protein mono-ADP-ribosyltransferase PARP9-like n=1 Tax=Neoarius graeffei TaxID=443677 RepID=UPI00298C5B57|nr:protein mono-ADP-ribosyltransferase PARP9-like [Neoarius graeffei]XP_060785166.1 protein mono-ADP-ribosyltransferase PARP9-like [Neoarius graeffei]XP_060785169.1 protein mono-ADP-ribosyltransferase PARP9-like [Neoarius graeffei]